MPTQTLSWDQLPSAVVELTRKVDHLTTLLSSQQAPAPDEVGGIALATQITRLSAARIYTLVSKREIPHAKRGNRLTFRRSQLIKWLSEGNREMTGVPDA